MRHAKDLFQFEFLWRGICVGFHDVRHHGPPTPHHRRVSQPIKTMVLLPRHDREEMMGPGIQEDAEVEDTGIAERRHEFGPDLVVTLLVFARFAFVQHHAKPDRFRVVHRNLHQRLVKSASIEPSDGKDWALMMYPLGAVTVASTSFGTRS